MIQKANTLTLGSCPEDIIRIMTFFILAEMLRAYDWGDAKDFRVHPSIKNLFVTIRQRPRDLHILKSSPLAHLKTREKTYIGAPSIKHLSYYKIKGGKI